MSEECRLLSCFSMILSLCLSTFEEERRREKSGVLLRKEFPSGLMSEFLDEEEDEPRPAGA